MSKLILTIMLVMFAASAEASLLGRVNSYYELQKSADVDKTQKEIASAEEELKQALEARKLVKAEDTEAIKNADALITQKRSTLAAKEQTLKEAKLLAPPQLQLRTASEDGVKTGSGEIALSIASGGGTPIEYTAYRTNMLLWKGYCPKDQNKKLDFLAGGGDQCTGDETKFYHFIPFYVMVHKNASTQITATTLTNDILNNEYGGLINLKFTPLLKEIYSTYSATDLRRDPSAMLTTFAFDAGFKGIEAPSLNAPKTINYVGSGYLGLTANFEFSLFNSTVTPQNIANNQAKADGHLAVGFGAYRNTIDSPSINGTNLLNKPLDRYFTTYVFGTELQLTNAFSLVGGRSIPADANNPLGSYTYITFKYQPGK